MEEKSKLRFHKEAFRTLLCGHLIPDLAGIVLDYFWVLMFDTKEREPGLKECGVFQFDGDIGQATFGTVFLCHSRSERRGVGRVRGDSGMDVDVLLTFLQKSKIIFACNY